MQSPRGAVLINVVSRPTGLERGETVAYRRARWRVGNNQIHAGDYLGEVLGLPGDVITFKAASFVVNGKVQVRKTAMPRQGEVTVPADRWFVWPGDFQREFNSHEQAFNFAQNAGLVAEADFLGRPYRRWLFRSQQR